MSLKIQRLSNCQSAMIWSAGMVLAAALLGGAALGQTAPTWSVTFHEPTTFSTSQMECQDFYSPRVYHNVLWMTGGGGGGETTQMTTGHILYFDRAAGFHPGDEVRVMRLRGLGGETEQFHGQFGFLNAMGVLFENIGRAQILAVNSYGTATARFQFACRAAQVGDFAIPWQPNVSPKLAPEVTVDFLQRLMGRAQLVAAGRGMISELGAGDELYLTGGARAGAQIGQRWLLFRRASSPSSWYVRQGTEGLSKSMYGEPGVDLSSLANAPKPAEIMGEAVVIGVTPRGATAIITYARDRILAGDEAVPAPPE